MVHNSISKWPSFFLSKLRNFEPGARMRRNAESRGGWLGGEQAMLPSSTDTGVTKEKNAARLCFKQNVYEKAHSSLSHLTCTSLSSCHWMDTIAYGRLKFWNLCKIIPHLSDTPSIYLLCARSTISWQAVAGRKWDKCIRSHHLMHLMQDMLLCSETTQRP